MSDLLAQMVTLLQPCAPVSKIASGAGPRDFNALTPGGLSIARFCRACAALRLPVSLLPEFVNVLGEQHLSKLMQLVGEEVRAHGRHATLSWPDHWMSFIEALRSTARTAASPGLSRGLADDRIALALRRTQETPSQPWTVGRLAKDAAVSRSAFFDRFHRALGVAPMEYLAARRMALANDLLRRKEDSLAEVAERVGYSSASTFSIAFTRLVERRRRVTHGSKCFNNRLHQKPRQLR